MTKPPEVGAMNETREQKADRFKRESGKVYHTSDCATSMAPAEEPGQCDCDAPEAGAEPSLKFHEPSSFLRIGFEPDALVHIDLADGSVSFGKNYTPEGAAKIFWDSLQVYGNTLAQRAEAAELQLTEAREALEDIASIGTTNAEHCRIRARLALRQSKGTK